MFNKQFSSIRSQDLTVFELSNLKQGKNKTLKVFMDRYQKMVRRVKGLNAKLSLQYVMPTLRPRPFKDIICRRQPKTMEELRERATDEVRVEEMKQSYRKETQQRQRKRTVDDYHPAGIGRTIGGMPDGKQP